MWKVRAVAGRGVGSLALIVAALIPPGAMMLAAGPAFAGTGGVACVQYDGTSQTLPVSVVASPVPMAPAGSLGGGQSAPATFTVYDSSGACVSGGPIYLYMSGTGTATPSTTGNCTPLGQNGSLTPNESSCTADSNGTVTVVFTTPTPLPTDGRTSIYATTSYYTAASTSQAYTFYDYTSCDAYVQGATTISSVSLSPTPIAPTASLTPYQQVPVSAEAIDAAGKCVAGAPIYLAATGYGTASAGAPTLLSSSWQSFVTDSQGVVPITYEAAGQQPNGGQGVIYASATDTGALSSAASTSYTYGTVTAQGVAAAVTEGQYFNGPVAVFQTDSSFASTFSAAIYWGDQTSSSVNLGSLAAGTHQIDASHLFAEENPAEVVTVIITSSDGPQVTVTSSLDVTDAPLSALGGLTLTGYARRATYWNLGTFTDPAPEDLSSYTATVNWGDGTAPTPVGGIYTINGSNGSNGYGFDATHTYKSKGTYTVTVTITDEGGTTTSTTDTAYISR